ncbi:family 20 glycosylhydrolase [Streptococcus rifensis]
MKKKIYTKLITLSVLMFQLNLSSLNVLALETPLNKTGVNTSSENQKISIMDSGLLLDVARRYYSIGSIRNYIDHIAENGGHFLHLHLTDDNYGIESHLLNQKAEDALYIEETETFINPNTNKPFLTFNQLSALNNYALSKGVYLVPEIDMPSHSKGIKELLSYADPTIAKQVKWFQIGDATGHLTDSDQLDIENEATMAFALSLQAEFVSQVPNLGYFHIGGDEFAGGIEYNLAFIDYVNRSASQLLQNGIVTRVWNDGFKHIDGVTHPKIDKSVQITYWNPQLEKDSSRMTADDLINAGYKLLNYNGYFLAMLPKSPIDQFISDAIYNANSIQKSDQSNSQMWSLEQFNMNTGDLLTNAYQGNVIGSAFSVWSEEAGDLNDQEIYNGISIPLKAFLNRMNTEYAVSNKKPESPYTTVSEKTTTGTVTSAVTMKQTTSQVPVTTPVTTEEISLTTQSEITSSPQSQTVSEIPVTTEDIVLTTQSEITPTSLQSQTSSLQQTISMPTSMVTLSEVSQTVPQEQSTSQSQTTSASSITTEAKYPQSNGEHTKQQPSLDSDTSETTLKPNNSFSDQTQPATSDVTQSKVASHRTLPSTGDSFNLIAIVGVALIHLLAKYRVLSKKR